MPGPITDSRATCCGTIAGMKRTFVDELAPAYGESHTKKRKVIHRLHRTQQVQYVPEPLAAEHDYTGQHTDFFDRQLQRAIALECKAIGFDGVRPEALEQFRAMVDGFMRDFLGQVRKSMTSARRTTTVPYDWVYALKSNGITGSSILEPHLDTGEIPPSLLQPTFEPPEPPEPPPPDLEGLLGPELSGMAAKQSRSWIPSHFPPFPSKHTWKATPVFTEREHDPRKIREKATEEGILAEQSLRKLMAAQKAGIQGNKARKQRRSKRIKDSDALWQTVMKDLMADEADRAEKARASDVDDELGDDLLTHVRVQAKPEKKINLEEGVHVNYDQKFWRKSARGI